MTALSLEVPKEPRRYKAASLARTVGWRLQTLWNALERAGQTRAAPEVARVARRMAATEPEIAADMLALARRWTAR